MVRPRSTEIMESRGRGWGRGWGREGIKPTAAFNHAGRTGIFGLGPVPPVNPAQSAAIRRNPRQFVGGDRVVAFEEACAVVILRQENPTRQNWPNQQQLFRSRFHFPFDSLAPARSALAGLRLWRIPFVASQATQVSPPFAGSVITWMSRAG